MVMLMNLYYRIKVKIIKEKVSKDVKDIRCWNIFDIFFCFCLIKVNYYIRGPPYQFRF